MSSLLITISQHPRKLTILSEYFYLYAVFTLKVKVFYKVKNRYKLVRLARTMGMISRVRGRIRSDSFSKIHTIKSEDKIANIGTLKCSIQLDLRMEPKFFIGRTR